MTLRDEDGFALEHFPELAQAVQDAETRYAYACRALQRIEALVNYVAEDPQEAERDRVRAGKIAGRALEKLGLFRLSRGHLGE